MLRVIYDTLPQSTRTILDEIRMTGMPAQGYLARQGTHLWPVA